MTQNSLHLLLAATLFTVSAPHVQAADANGNYAIWGVGRASCHQFLKSQDGAGDDRYKVFLMGYLTALNTVNDDTYNAIGDQPLNESLDWLSDYCDMHQMDSFDRAVQQLVTARYDARQRVPPGRERGWGHAAAGGPGGRTEAP